MNEDQQVLDHHLENELRGIAARLDPVPDALLRAAEAALTWRTIDAELAELVFDSRTDPDGMALVRGGELRLLTFHAAGMTIELELTPEDTEHRLVGQLLPPGPARVEVRHPDGILAVEADELGRFAAERVPTGPISLHCRPGAAGPEAPVVTEWVPI